MNQDAILSNKLIIIEIPIHSVKYINDNNLIILDTKSTIQINTLLSVIFNNHN